MFTAAKRMHDAWRHATSASGRWINVPFCWLFLLLLRLLRLLLVPAVAVELMLSDAGAVDCGLEYLAWYLFFGITLCRTHPGHRGDGRRPKEKGEPAGSTSVR